MRRIGNDVAVRLAARADNGEAKSGSSGTAAARLSSFLLFIGPFVSYRVRNSRTDSTAAENSGTEAMLIRSDPHRARPCGQEILGRHSILSPHSSIDRQNKDPP